MLIDGIRLTEGSSFDNLTVASGDDFPSLPNTGELFYRTDTLFVFDGTEWSPVAAEAVEVTKATVGLGNVDNTSDAAKPVSTAQAAALALKMDKSARNAAYGVAGLTAERELTLPSTGGSGDARLRNDTAGDITVTLPTKSGVMALTSDLVGVGGEGSALEFIREVVIPNSGAASMLEANIFTEHPEFSAFCVMLDAVMPTTASSNLCFRFCVGGAPYTGAYYHSKFGGATSFGVADTRFTLSGVAYFSAIYWITGINGASTVPTLTGTGGGIINNTQPIDMGGTGVMRPIYAGQGVPTGFQWYMSTASILGRFRIFGLRNTK